MNVGSNLYTSYTNELNEKITYLDRPDASLKEHTSLQRVVRMPFYFLSANYTVDMKKGWKNYLEESSGEKIQTYLESDQLSRKGYPKLIAIMLLKNSFSLIYLLRGMVSM